MNCGACGYECPGQCGGGVCKCTTQSAANLWPDGGIDGDAADWVNQSTSTLAYSRASRDLANCPTSGSLLDTSAAPAGSGGVFLSHCVAIPSTSKPYNLGGWLYIPSATAGGSPYVNIGLFLYADASCTTTVGAGAADRPWDVWTAPSGVSTFDAWFHLHKDGITVPSETKAGRFYVGVIGNAQMRAQTYFDSLYFTPAPGRF
ncbi:MAG TPA: hypothetical protein VHU40_20180 [Polyangia bacterium]|jgi:hypothetical protein|nr:hypothetical protein [Polyangia bacterium]